MRIVLFLLVLSTNVVAQEVNAEYDKNRDLSRYKSFTFGESEFITPKDRQQIDEAKLHKLVKTAIAEELTEKGLQHSDSLGDLIVSYVIGSQARTDFSVLGPLGTSPDNSSQTWSRDYQMGSLIIDLNDRSNNLIWRVNATSDGTTDINGLVAEIVAAGFKKFSLKPKKVKKKK